MAQAVLVDLLKQPRLALNSFMAVFPSAEFIDTNVHYELCSTILKVELYIFVTSVTEVMIRNKELELGGGGTYL